MTFSITNLLVTPAFADSGTSASFDFMGILPFVLILGIMYFLLIRPQQKKQKEHQELLKTLKVGDKILTTGGIFSKISKIVDENELEVEVSKDVKIQLLRSSVMQVVSRGAEKAQKSKTQTKQIKKKPAKSSTPKKK